MNPPEIDPDKEQERLDDLGRRIERTRAEVDDEDPATEHRPTFAESGDERGGDGEDDQTIAPPG